MNPNSILGYLKAEWRNYLIERGHYIYRAGTSRHVVRSRNPKRHRYRWLLLVGLLPRRMLIKSEQSDIRQHLRQARKKKERVYLVVGFVHEPRRIVVLPADAALKAQCVRSDKGGIAWKD